jgi:hypothetical protein
LKEIKREREKRRRGRRRKQLLYVLKEKIGYRKLRQAAPIHNLWRTRCGRGHETVVREIME